MMKRMVFVFQLTTGTLAEHLIELDGAFSELSVQSAGMTFAPDKIVLAMPEINPGDIIPPPALALAAVFFNIIDGTINLSDMAKDYAKRAGFIFDEQPENVPQEAGEMPFIVDENGEKKTVQ